MPAQCQVNSENPAPLLCGESSAKTRLPFEYDDDLSMQPTASGEDGARWDIGAFPGAGASVTAATYYAHAWGKSVIENIYPSGTNAQFGYVETNFHF